MFGSAFDALLGAALHQPVVQAAIIVLGTFILEDAATVLAAMRASEGAVPVAVALGALYVGIVLGDLGLYGLGRLAAGLPWIERHLPRRRLPPARDWLEARLGRTVLTTRFIPGLRLPTYTACGYLGVSFGRFTLAAIGATLLWTSLLFGVSLGFGAVIMRYLGAWRWAGAIGFALGVIVIGRLATRQCLARR